MVVVYFTAIQLYHRVSALFSLRFQDWFGGEGAEGLGVRSSEGSREKTEWCGLRGRRVEG